MSLIKRGRFYWLDIRIKGQRIRRSLHTTHKSVALARYGEKREELESELGIGKIKFSDFCQKYMDWAWASKPKSAQGELYKLRRIQEFFDNQGILFLDNITPFHIEQFKASLRTAEKPISKATTDL